MRLFTCWSTRNRKASSSSSSSSSVVSVVAVYFLCQVTIYTNTSSKQASALSIDSIRATDIRNGGNLLSSDDINQPILIVDAVPVAERRQWWKHIQARSKNELVQVQVEERRRRRHQTTKDRKDDDDDDDDDSSSLLLEQELLHALELVEGVIANPSNNDDDDDDDEDQWKSVYISSIGSSCSIDQLPIYDYGQSFFQEKDILSSCFSSYTPMHDQLVVSCNEAQSTLCSQCYTSIILCLGGGSIDYWYQPQTPKNLKEYDASRSITRTWEGNDFTMGWRSSHSLPPIRTTKKKIVATTSNNNNNNNPKDHLTKDDDNDDTTTICRRVTVEPGDILIIPPNWWYQSEARERKTANISILSKRYSMNEFVNSMMKDVVISSRKVVDDDNVSLPSILSSLSLSTTKDDENKEIIHNFFEYINSRNQ